MKEILSANEFVKFLKTDESLHSFYISECELYCLANILGAPIHMLTYSMVGGRTETKWDTYEPHQGLIHNNKFFNRRPLYIVHDKNVQFSRLVIKKWNLTENFFNSSFWIDEIQIEMKIVLGQV